MGNRKKSERDKGVPVGPVSLKIAELGVQKGLGQLEERGLSEAIRQAVSKHAGREIDSGNWSNYWSGWRIWPKIAKKGNLPVLEMVAAYFEVSIVCLLDLRTPIAILAEVSFWEDLPYKDRWSPEDAIGEVTNWKWEGEQINKIYALRVKDSSMELLALVKGDILYVKKDPPPEEIVNGKLVVYSEDRKRAIIRQITLGPEHIFLSLPGKIADPLPRRCLRDCDLVIMTSNKAI